MRIQPIFLLLVIASFSACSPGKNAGKSARAIFLDNPELKTAHIGISIYDPSTGSYVYDYQGDHYFVPASNTKLLMCYAAMKYLGDSLEGWAVHETPEDLYILPKGDPTFLHPDFPGQAFFQFLTSTHKNIQLITNSKDRFEAYGSGWAWNDYLADYMPQRSRFDIYGNVVTFEASGDQLRAFPPVLKPPYLSEPISQTPNFNRKFSVSRLKEKNLFSFKPSAQDFKKQQVPFITDPMDTVQMRFLLDTLHMGMDDWRNRIKVIDIPFLKPVFTQPVDSLLKVTMHRSDNFFAEQTLLMVSEKLLGYMSDARVIDSLLSTDYKDMPQRPKWVDGSGLSRYNLVTPRDFVFVLNKMKNEFDWKRITAILPTGGTGTFSNFYKSYAGRFYGKTGTLSNQVAMSGYIQSRSGKWLICSVLVNNTMAPAANVRKAVEQFVTGVAERY